MSAPRLSEQLLAQINDLQSQYAKAAAAEFKDGFKDLFGRHERLKTVTFRGYTPSFCDGDPCTFHSSHEEPYINGFSEYGETLEGDDSDHEGDDGERVADPTDLFAAAEAGDKKAQAVVDEVVAFLRSFPESFYEGRFGSDGYEVTASRRGFREEGYDCGY